MKSLVTGVAGFIGSHVADALAADGHHVIGIDDLSGGFERNVSKGIRFEKCSVLDEQRLEQLFAEHKFDYVFHLAAYAAEGLSHFIRKFNYTNNVIGSVNLINLAVRHKVKCFVFTSSIAVYGRNQTPMIESLMPTPEDPYGVAKHAVELDLRAAHEMFGLNSIIFRPHNVYGERQHIGDRYRNVIGIFMNQLMQGNPMTIFGDGTQTRAFSYVGDVAPIIARSVKEPKAINETFNVGADTPITLNDLARYVSESMGVPMNVKHVEARKEVQHAYADHSKVTKIFNYHAKTDIREGLDRMAKWAKSIGHQQPTRFEGIEIEENLPPVWRTK